MTEREQSAKQQERPGLDALFDTNICIYIMNQHPAEVIKKFRQINVGDIGVSSITVSELQASVRSF